MPDMTDSAWLSELYERYRRELFLTAWQVLRDSGLAEDAVHSAFAKLVQAAKRPEDPKLYVFRCVRNAAVDLARTKSRRREEHLEPNWDISVGCLDESHTEATALVARLLERLDDAGREVIGLHLHAKMTFAEIAKLFGEPLPTVTSRYRRALEKLGQQVDICHE